MNPRAIELLNAWSPDWSAAMTRSLVEGSVMLLVIGMAWFLGRRWMSSGFAYGLFLLVVIKAVASALSPWTLPVPVPVVLSTPRPTPRTAVVEPRESRPQPAPIEDLSFDKSVIDASSIHIASSLTLAAAAPQLSRISWLMLAWAAIVSGLLTRFAGRHVRAGWQFRDATEIDPATLPVDPARLAERAGLSRPVPLLQSNRVHAPAVWGLLRPRVLIPEGMLEGLSREQVTWVVLHELTHIARKDTWVVLAQRIIQSVFFFHPAVWVANRLADVQREFACDESALALGSLSRHDCGEGFLTIAERARRPRVVASPMALGLFGSSSLIRKRLEHLLDDSRTPSARLSRSAIAILAVAALVAASRVQARPQAPAAPVPPAAAQAGVKERSIEVSVVDSRTGRPMPGVDVEADWYDAKKVEKTDASGRCIVTIPQGELSSLRIKARKEGFVPLADTWAIQGLLAKPLPEKYTFTMEPGTTIGGVIQDEQGAPISGATVFVGFFFPRRGVVGATPFLLDEPCVTDASGRWQCKIMPEKLPLLLLRLAHPDYISGSNHEDSPPPLMAKLRDGSRVMVMKKGLPVAGVVRGADGRPVAGATVAFGKDQAVSNNPTETTNAQGEFRFAHVAPGELILVAQAKGRAPELQQVKVEPKMQSVMFTLGPAHSIRGRIVDGAGKPIPGAWVTADEWRGYRSLMIKVVSDADGRFQVDDLPESPVEYQFSKEGYANLPNKAIAPSDQEVVITLAKPLTISGTVTDAATGKPIDSFTLLDANGPGSWDRDYPRPFRGGRYIRNIVWPVPQVHSFRVEAEGYLPADSRVFQMTEGTVSYDFRLTKGEVPIRPAVSGVILLPDGKPAAGAEVALASKTSGPSIRNGRDTAPERHPRMIAGPDGAFQFPPQIEETAVMAFHDQGYAEMTEDALVKAPSHALTLRKWGRVEGILRVGTKPAADEQVVLNPRRSGPEWLVHHYVRYEAKTDFLGRFVFDRVIPGTANVSRGIWTAPSRMSFGPWLAVEVAPGGTTQVRLGGTGRPVIGRFAVPAGSDLPIDWTRTHHRLQLKSPPGPQLKGATKEERIKEYAKWILTEEGKAYDAWQKDRRSYGFRIETDGSFRIDDVTAGTYDLYLEAFDSYGNGRKTLASADRTVVVPEMEGGQSVEPLDLGTIELGPPAP